MTFEPNRPASPQPAEPFQPVGPDTPVGTTPVVPTPVAASALASPARRAPSGGRLLNLVLVVAAAVAVGGVAFAIGRGSAPASATTGNGRVLEGAFPGGSFKPGASGAPGVIRGGPGGGLAGGLTVTGTVESVDGDMLTIRTKNGQTITVATGGSTSYHTQTDASAADVTAGTTVQVQLDGITGRPNASAAPDAPIGTAGSVTVIP